MVNRRTQGLFVILEGFLILGSFTMDIANVIENGHALKWIARFLYGERSVNFANAPSMSSRLCSTAARFVRL
jgi:hypothetical protein